jgi:hypothetical protein
MPKPAVPPPGFVLIRVDDLARLVTAAEAPRKVHQVESSRPEPSGPATADVLTFAAALTAIGVLTARINWPGVTQAESLGGEPPEPVIRALALFCEHVLAAVFPDKACR